jgi:transcription antitermination factor NusG
VTDERSPWYLFNGEVQAHAAGRVTVLLQMFGRQMPVPMGADAVELVA